jgi:predicted PurR-regulated permease PerM
MIDRPAAHDLPRITFVVLAILIITVASAWVLSPFLAPLVWATMIVIATWPVLLWLQRLFGGRRGPAVAVMLIPILTVLVVPLWIGISAVVGNADRVVEFVRNVSVNGLPPLPDWVGRIPLVGDHITTSWTQVAGKPASLAARVTPYLGEATRWLAARAGSLGATILQLLLTVIIAGVLYASGEQAGMGVRRFLRRLAGERGENAGILAAKATRAVALGIVVTAILQSTLAALGLFAASVPGAALLAAVCVVLCFAQIGPLIVMAPATIWLYAEGAVGRGTVLLLFTLVASTVDNVLRPLLIKKGADLPFLLILAGVLGGVVGFGVVGLFVGPVVLAVTWTLVSSWVAELDTLPDSPPSKEQRPAA